MFDVTYAIYGRKAKEGKSPYIPVTYFCGMKSFKQFVFPEAKGYGKHIFHDWWKMRMAIAPPETTDEALKYISNFRLPRRIRVWMNKKVKDKVYPEILGVEF